MVRSCYRNIVNFYRCILYLHMCGDDICLCNIKNLSKIVHVKAVVSENHIEAVYTFNNNSYQKKSLKLPVNSKVCDL